MNQQVTDPVSQELKELSEDYDIHNLKTCEKDGWHLFVWTDAATCFPWDGMTVSLRLVFSKGSLPLVKSTKVEVNLRQVCWGQEERFNAYEVSFRPFQRRLVGLESKIVDAFASKLSSLGDDALTKELPRGAYLVSVTLMIDEQIVLKPPDIPIQVLTRGLVEKGVRFWKRRNKEKGGVELMPELERNE
jgi:hypothetical protein